ncbi:hypothetical protein Glove_265g28 [Diversispora epigaea]|uniref:Uncharacterized protein n=1 Tax=Diversispora epigaea TaxID=1348612 RepID=A0A397I7I5_9GLOM|nr:hypothetical protein Glove_265g28 [Diversispora epigaea]
MKGEQEDEEKLMIDEKRKPLLLIYDKNISVGQKILVVIIVIMLKRLEVGQIKLLLLYYHFGRGIVKNKISNFNVFI